MEQMEVKVVEAQPKYLAMFSDGLENLVIERATQQPFFGFFNNVFQWLEGQSTRLRVEAELSGVAAPRLGLRPKATTTSPCSIDHQKVNGVIDANLPYQQEAVMETPIPAWVSAEKPQFMRSTTTRTW